jgi:hypothetical protein
MNMATRFPGVLKPKTDFGDVRSRIRTLPFYVDIPLTQARSVASGSTLNPSDSAGAALLLPFNANFVYVDQKANSGFVTVHFQDDAGAGVTPITAYPGFVARIGFTQLIIENTAQAGKTLRLLYGVDLDFLPAGVYGNVTVDGTVAIQGTVTVSGTVNTQEQGYQYGAAYVSNAVIPAGVTSQVFASASNVNGAIVHSCMGYTQSAAAPALILLTKSGAAPTTLTDGDALTFAFAAAGVPTTSPPLTGPVKIAPGKGLWWWSSVLETGAYRSVLYTLL